MTLQELGFDILQECTEGLQGFVTTHSNHNHFNCASDRNHQLIVFDERSDYYGITLYCHGMSTIYQLTDPDLVKNIRAHLIHCAK